MMLRVSNSSGQNDSVLDPTSRRAPEVTAFTPSLELLKSLKKSLCSLRCGLDYQGKLSLLKENLGKEEELIYSDGLDSNQGL